PHRPVAANTRDGHRVRATAAGNRRGTAGRDGAGGDNLEIARIDAEDRLIEGDRIADARSVRCLGCWRGAIDRLHIRKDGIKRDLGYEGIIRTAVGGMNGLVGAAGGGKVYGFGLTNDVGGTRAV